MNWQMWQNDYGGERWIREEQLTVPHPFRRRYSFRKTLSCGKKPPPRVANRGNSDTFIRMMGKIGRFALVAVVLSLTLLSQARLAAAQRAPDPAEVMARVQENYDKAGSFKTWFQQETRPPGARHGDQASGVMYFQKPSRMRWEYLKPPDQKKEVISDGRQVWIYLPEDALVLVYPLNQVLRSDLVLRFFSGIGQVQNDFKISWQRPPVLGAHYVIKLVPRQRQAELQRLILTIDPYTHIVENLEFSNALGETTRFDFSGTILGTKKPPQFFTFIPPPGVQVVREAPGIRY